MGFNIDIIHGIIRVLGFDHDSTHSIEIKVNPLGHYWRMHMLQWEGGGA